MPSPPRLRPDDDANRRLLAAVHPAGWVNPEPAGPYDLVVVGAGTAGLVAAAGAAGLGARVALIERHLMGGDCLNTGCVPSKALLAAARAATHARTAARFGVRTELVRVDFAAVMKRMREERAHIAPHDGAARFRDLGVDVFLGSGAFTGPRSIAVAGRELRFSRAVIATGARATAPPIPGLAEAGYLTHDTLFGLTQLPERLAIIGDGSIGCEMAQAFSRFGAQVTLVEIADRLLGHDDPDAARVVQRALERDGVRVRLGAAIARVEPDRTLVVGDERLGCDVILVAAGRAARIEGLGLEAAGVRASSRGVEVDDRLRTTNQRVYAAGDVASQLQLTHAADAMSRIALRNALFRGRAKASALVIPWCTYTEPELAHVGLTPALADERGVALDTIEVEMRAVDRARLDGETEGFLRVHLRRGKDEIVGATLVSAHAGETISALSLAMTNRIGLGGIARTVHPYPTQGEVLKRAADAWSRTRLTPRVKRLVERVLRWQR
jgi:pyruvate/2-oxoglutarate dehydrogenase complex dihydrolipoamide dehydrogenase (E3) component